MPEPHAAHSGSQLIFTLVIMNLATILSIISALVTLFIVSPHHTAGWISGGQIAAAILLLPNLFLAIGCLLYSVAKLGNKEQKGQALVVLLLSCVMPVIGGYEIIYPRNKRDDDRRVARAATIADWQALGVAVNPLLREFYQKHPDKFRFIHNDDEATIDGFIDYAAEHGIGIKRGQIRDPWGDGVHFVVDHDGDFALKARGQFYGVGDQVSGIVAVGLLLDRPSRATTAYNEQWSLGNGFIPKKR